MQKIFVYVVLAANILMGFESMAQILVEDPTPTPLSRQEQADKPKTGRGAATDYFKHREKKVERKPSESGGERVLMLHVGTFLNDKAYRWGSKNKVEDPGEMMVGVTYRVGEWKNSMDLSFRAELISYSIDNEKPLKLSAMPVISFPDARSEFPLYFGAGIGAGIFFKQVGEESDLAMDYALLIGARFSELFEMGGVFFETGLKGQVHLLSSGQQDGVFLAGGVLFEF